MDRDEFPPVVVNTGNKASARHVSSADNRGAGVSLGSQIKTLPNGTNVRVIPKNVIKEN